MYVLCRLQAKDVTHIWELGGGTLLSKLVDVPITVDNLRYNRVRIMIAVHSTFHVLAPP